MAGSYCNYLTYSEDYGLGCYLDKSLIADDSVDTNCLYITTPYIDLTKGSYKVSIVYVTDSTDKTYSVTSKYRTYPIITGHELVSLSSQKQREEFSFFSPISVDEYQVHINYGSEGSLFVESVSICETNAWKNILLFYIVLFSLFVDVIVWKYQRIPEARRRRARLTLILFLGLVMYTSVPIFSYFMAEGDDLMFHLNRIEVIKYSVQAAYKFYIVFQLKRFLQLCKAAVGIILCNLWFLVPFVDYFLKGYIASSDSMNVLGRFNANGAFLSQMISFFQQGKNPSYSVAESLIFPYERNYTAGIFLLVAFCYLCCRLYRGKEELLIVRIGDCSMLFGALSMFMCTIWFPWDFFQQMNGLFRLVTRNIQLPWRFLGAGCFFLTITAVCLVMAMQNMQNQHIYYGVIVAICSFALLSADYFMTDFTNRALIGHYADENDLSSCARGDGEYLPDNTPPDFSANRAVLPEDSLEIVQEEYQKGIHTVTCSNLSDEDTYADMLALPYEGYTCYDVETGQKLSVSLEEPGKVRAIVPASYQGTLTVVFKEPWYWRTAELLSVLSLLVGSLYLWSCKYKKQILAQRRMFHE